MPLVSRILPELADRTRPEGPDALWSALDDHGIEIETGELLYALVRAVKPMLVREAGSFPGVGSRAMLRALLDNGRGHLIGSEVDADYRAQLREMFKPLGAAALFVEKHETYEDADFVFLDSPADRRPADLARFVTTARPGTLCVYHDVKGPSSCAEGPFGNRGLERIDLGTPRGVRVYQR